MKIGRRLEETTTAIFHAGENIRWLSRYPIIGSISESSLIKTIISTWALSVITPIIREVDTVNYFVLKNIAIPIFHLESIDSYNQAISLSCGISLSCMIIVAMGGMTAISSRCIPYKNHMMIVLDNRGKKASIHIQRNLDAFELLSKNNRIRPLEKEIIATIEGIINKTIPGTSVVEEIELNSWMLQSESIRKWCIRKISTAIPELVVIENNEWSLDALKYYLGKKRFNHWNKESNRDFRKTGKIVFKKKQLINGI